MDGCEQWRLKKKTLVCKFFPVVCTFSHTTREHFSLSLAPFLFCLSLSRMRHLDSVLVLEMVIIAEFGVGRKAIVYWFVRVSDEEEGNVV
jgi:hypothetical protein